MQNSPEPPSGQKQVKAAAPPDASGGQTHDFSGEPQMLEEEVDAALASLPPALKLLAPELQTEDDMHRCEDLPDALASLHTLAVQALASFGLLQPGSYSANKMDAALQAAVAAVKQPKQMQPADLPKNAVGGGATMPCSTKLGAFFARGKLAKKDRDEFLANHPLHITFTNHRTNFAQPPQPSLPMPAMVKHSMCSALDRGSADVCFAQTAFLNLGGLAKAAGGLAGAAGVAGNAGAGKSKLLPEPKAESPRERFKLMLAMKRTGYPDDHSPQPDAGSRGQMAFKALHWARHEVASALRAAESMKFVKEQAAVAKSIADKAAVQLKYLMESPCMRGVDKDPGQKAQLPDQNQQLPGVKLDTKAVTQLQSPWDVAAVCSTLPILRSHGQCPRRRPVEPHRPLGPAQMGCFPAQFPLQGHMAGMPTLGRPPAVTSAVHAHPQGYVSSPQGIACGGCATQPMQLPFGVQPMAMGTMPTAWISASQSCQHLFSLRIGTRLGPGRPLEVRQQCHWLLDCHCKRSCMVLTCATPSISTIHLDQLRPPTATVEPAEKRAKMDALALEAPYAQRTVISPKGVQPLQQSLFRKSGTAPLSQVSTTSSAPVYRRQVTGPASPSSLTTGVVARPATNSMQDATPTAASPLAQAAFQPLERRPRWASMSEGPHDVLRKRGNTARSSSGGPDGNEMMSPMASQGQPAVMATTLPERRPRWASICEGVMRETLETTVTMSLQLIGPSSRDAFAVQRASAIRSREDFQEVDGCSCQARPQAIFCPFPLHHMATFAEMTPTTVPSTEATPSRGDLDATEEFPKVDLDLNQANQAPELPESEPRVRLQVPNPREDKDESEPDDEDAVCEFSLWAAPRWHLLRELLMDEDLNNVALGGFTVGKFQVGGLARRCITSKDWARSINLLGFQGDGMAVFRAIASECCSEEQENQLRAAGVDFSDVITLAQLRRFEAQKTTEGLILTVRDEGSPAWQFAQFLRRRRQNLLRAWRLDLDKDDSGTVTFVEFSILGLDEAGLLCTLAARSPSMVEAFSTAEPQAVPAAQPNPQPNCRRALFGGLASAALAAVLIVVGVEEWPRGGHDGPGPSPPGPASTSTMSPTSTPSLGSYECISDLDLGQVVNASQKGMAVDDTTFHICSDRIPDRWPNSATPLGSLRLFKAWDQNWPDDQRIEGWKKLTAMVHRGNVRVLVGTQVTCNETDDDKDWDSVRQLLQLLGPNHVMAVAVGNELELLQFKSDIPASCVKNVWEGGYFYRKFVERVEDLQNMKGFEEVPFTSVFGGYILAGSPFVDTPQARVLSFLQNVTDTYGEQWIYSLNVYPYFDPNNRLDPNSTTKCKKALAKALCMEEGCLLPSITSQMRKSMVKLSSTATQLWLTETGWSFPQAASLPGANSAMAKCKNFSSEIAFRTYYQNFLKWNLTIGNERGPDHAFFFTLRDALNFGVGEHFGLIKDCASSSCKLQDVARVKGVEDFSTHPDTGLVFCICFAVLQRNQCRQLGFQGRVRQIWSSLRPLDDRALEFAELAPVEAEHLESFADLIWNVSGYDLDKAWGLFDYEKKNKLTKADFMESSEHLGYKGNAEMLFKGLDREGLGWIWRGDFDYIPKVSRNARARLKETEGPLATLVSFARSQMGGCEVQQESLTFHDMRERLPWQELVTKLGLGGGTSEVTVCDLAARLTALGFDGDAQHAAVQAARLGPAHMDKSSPSIPVMF
eukprot:symbB.v1.2.022088.t1/scaffold1938.1/size102858/10